MIRDKVGVTPNIRRRSEDATMRRCEKINLPRCRRVGGRPKKNCSEVIRNELKTLLLTEYIDQNRKF